MADFCHQCSLDLFGFDSGDLANLGTLEPGTGFSVICEDCGFILVDELGNCIKCDLKPDKPGHGPARFNPGETGLSVFRKNLEKHKT
jgi:hypothetical protein